MGVNNNPMGNAAPECPWVGHKKSGYGFHSGEDGWRQFSVPKSIVYIEEEAPGVAAATFSGVPPFKTPEEVAQYLQKHQLEEKIQSAVNAALKAGGEDPIADIVAALRSKM